MHSCRPLRLDHQTKCNVLFCWSIVVYSLQTIEIRNSINLWPIFVSKICGMQKSFQLQLFDENVPSIENENKIYSENAHLRLISLPLFVDAHSQSRNHRILLYVAFKIQIQITISKWLAFVLISQNTVYNSNFVIISQLHFAKFWINVIASTASFGMLQ